MSFWKKKENLIISGFVVFFFVGLGVWYDYCCVRAAFFSAGAPMSAFEVQLQDENQKEVTLSKLIGKPMIVNIWATWCPVCVKKMGSFNRFAEKFKANGGQIVSVSQDRGGVPVVRDYYKRNGYNNLPIYIDSSGLLLSTFGGRGLPTAIFIDASGKEVGRLEGGVDWDSDEVARLVDYYFGVKLSK